MAKKIIETITDDLDGSEGASTVTFSYGSQSYEIDLSPRNADKLDKALSQFIGAARRTGKTSAPSKAGRKRELGPVRTWAAKNGFELNDRGRIPKEVLEAYDAAN